jgi:hypothetical protein
MIFAHWQVTSRYWSILCTRTGHYNERGNTFRAEAFIQVDRSSRIDVHGFVRFTERYRWITLRSEMEYAVRPERRNQSPQPLDVPNIAVFERRAVRSRCDFTYVKTKHGAACLHAIICQISADKPGCACDHYFHHLTSLAPVLRLCTRELQTELVPASGTRHRWFRGEAPIHSGYLADWRDPRESCAG